MNTHIIFSWRNKNKYLSDTNSYLQLCTIADLSLLDTHGKVHFLMLWIILLKPKKYNVHAVSGILQVLMVIFQISHSKACLEEALMENLCTRLQGFRQS